MKNLISIILVCFILLSLTACGDSGSADSTGNKSNTGSVSSTESTDNVERLLDPMEYTIYMNIFQSNQGNDYIDKTYTKEGIFTTLKDSFNSTVRYYVWGYSDETLCCDWQWEFVPENPDKLPPIGSHVKVTGKFVENENALDGYWLENASVESVSEFNGVYGDNDTTTMSPTLTRVQIINMTNYATEYNGQSVKVYGRIASGNKLQHPYYDGAWDIPLEYSENLPSIGTYVTVIAKFSGTSVDDSKLIVDSIKTDKTA